MTDDTAPSNGAGDSSRNEREQDTPAGETAEEGRGLTREELAAANEQLRERVADLEAALADVQESLAENSGDTSADSSEAANGAIEAHEEATADQTPELVTSGGQPTKVIGKLDDDQGIGILGEATATSTVTYGVQGITQSADVDAAGVRASASNGARGVDAEAANNHAVRGVATGHDAIYAETDGSFSNAFYGENTSTSGAAWGVRGDTRSESSDAYGVKGKVTVSPGSAKGVGGETLASGDGAAGVEGLATADSGVTYGVKGETNSSDGYGLYTPNDASVEGSMSVGNTGVAAYRSSNQTISNNTDTTVAFDSTVVDHFGGMNTSNGVYTVQEPGDYHVSFTIDWSTRFDSNVSIDYELQTNGDTLGQAIQADIRTSGTSQEEVGSYSRTLFGLDSGDTIEVVVNQDSGESKDIYGGEQETYMTIHRVG